MFDDPNLVVVVAFLLFGLLLFVVGVWSSAD